MRKELMQYWIPYIEKIHPYNTEINSDNYVRYKDNRNQKLIRVMNGKTITLKGNIYQSKKYSSMIYNMYEKLYLRYLKETHSQKLFRNKNEKETPKDLTFYVMKIFCNASLRDYIKLYIHKL